MKCDQLPALAHVKLVINYSQNISYCFLQKQLYFLHTQMRFSYIGSHSFALTSYAFVKFLHRRVRANRDASRDCADHDNTFYLDKWPTITTMLCVIITMILFSAYRYRRPAVLPAVVVPGDCRPHRHHLHHHCRVSTLHHRQKQVQI